jgi:hypothetical protein
VYLIVKSITDLKSPQPCHGKNLAKLARECFANRQPLTVDFDDVETITQGFFQELLLPLVAEFGADFLRSNLKIANVSTDIEEIIKSAFNKEDGYVDQCALVHNKECDVEIYELNLAWLIKARELARENSILAELTMGIGDKEMRSALSQLSIKDIQRIAQSGWLCFSPRFTTHFIQSISTRPHEVVDVLLGLSDSL